MYLVLQFEKFLKERNSKNIKDKLEEFKQIMINPTNEAIPISDEIIDFIDQINGTPNRFQSFARYIETRYDVKKYNNVLEIGCGTIAGLSKELIKKGYKVTCVDKVDLKVDDIPYIKTLFDHKTFDVSNYDLLVGLEPCEATEHILLSAIENNKPFAISLCDVPHDSIDGEKFKTCKEWDNYLIKKSNDKAYIDEKKVLNKSHRILRNK